MPRLVMTFEANAEEVAWAKGWLFEQTQFGRCVELSAGPAARKEPLTITPPAGKRKLRDTIFEKAPHSGEKTGGEDLSAGQPTSTAEVHIERPERPRPNAAAARREAGMNAEMAALAERMGLKPPSTAEEDAAEVFARAGAAPAPEGAHEVRRVTAFDGGRPVSGKVHVYSPFGAAPFGALAQVVSPRGKKGAAHGEEVEPRRAKGKAAPRARRAGKRENPARQAPGGAQVEQSHGPARRDPGQDDGGLEA